MSRRSLTFAFLLALAPPAHTDWCDGSRYGFLDMPLSQRLDAARKAVAEENAGVERALTELRLDLGERQEEARTRLAGERQRVAEQVHALCTEAAGTGGGRPPAAERRARVRLLLVTAATLAEAGRRLEGESAQRRLLADRLETQRAGLAALREELAHVAEQGDAPQATLLLRTACAAVGESGRLRDAVPHSTLDQLYAAAARTAGNPAEVDDQAVEAALERCEVVVAPPSHEAEPEESAPWWRRWWR